MRGSLELLGLSIPVAPFVCYRRRSTWSLQCGTHVAGGLGGSLLIALLLLDCDLVLDTFFVFAFFSSLSLSFASGL